MAAPGGDTAGTRVPSLTGRMDTQIVIRQTGDGSIGDLLIREKAPVCRAQRTANSDALLLNDNDKPLIFIVLLYHTSGGYVKEI